MIVFTPTKTMKPTTKEHLGTELSDRTKSTKIRNKLQSYDKESLATLLKIKNKTLDTTYEYYQQTYHAVPAIKLYDGISFKQIKTYNYDYIKNNVAIISALYGSIRGTDLIQPYRLDFLTKKFMEENLYQYWREDILQFIEQNQVRVILNLASNEYIKAVKQLKLDLPIIDVEFTNKQSSTNMKKYRGMILEYCIANEVIDYSNLVGATIENLKILELNENILKIEA